MKIYLKDSNHFVLGLDENKSQIAEGLLRICGLTTIRDDPRGVRVFTVEKMPDNVPCAHIYWEIYDEKEKPSE